MDRRYDRDELRPGEAILDHRLWGASKEYQCAGCRGVIQVGEQHISHTKTKHWCLACWQLYVPLVFEAIRENRLNTLSAPDIGHWKRGKRIMKAINKMLAGGTFNG